MIRILTVALLLVLTTATGFAQTWPSPTTRILVGLGPGSGLDLLGRVFADAFAEKTGASFIVENRTGGGGNLSVSALANAKADGSTIALVTFTPLVINPLMVKTGYDPLVDVIPVTQVAETPSVLLASKKLGVGSMKEFLALIQASPDKYSYATPGPGTVSHLTMEVVAGVAGTKMVHAPFRGTPEQIQSLLTGEVDAATVQVGFVADMLKSDKVVALAISADTRWPSLPDIPTAAEAGIPGLPTTQWIGMFAPKGTPRSVVDRINIEVNEVLARPEVRSRMATLFYKPVGSSPDELAAKLKSDRELWQSVLDKLGLLVR